MSDPDAISLGRGLSSAPPERMSRGPEIAATVLSLIWIVICGVLWLRPGIDWTGPLVLIWLTGFLVPIALMWLSVAAVRTSRELRAEGEQLRAAIAELRRSERAAPQDADPSGPLASRLDALGAAQNEIRDQLASLIEGRTADQPAVVATTPAEALDPQPSLSLGTPAEELEAPITIAEFIRALNFPENEHDAEGFQMLRKALNDRSTQRLVRASQDVLTLLSQDGIYMDDLRPDRARPEVWRAFARGDRGRAVAGLGGVHDRSSLALAAGRMKQDPVFRDATHHFLRGFDQTFMEFERHASDEDIIRLADTRTARAFMLLGRVTGMFD